jgi:hypothetical protein
LAFSTPAITLSVIIAPSNSAKDDIMVKRILHVGVFVSQFSL